MRNYQSERWRLDYNSTPTLLSLSVGKSQANSDPTRPLRECHYFDSEGMTSLLLNPGAIFGDPSYSTIKTPANADVLAHPGHCCGKSTCRARAYERTRAGPFHKLPLNHFLTCLLWLHSMHTRSSKSDIRTRVRFGGHISSTHCTRHGRIYCGWSEIASRLVYIDTRGDYRRDVRPFYRLRRARWVVARNYLLCGARWDTVGPIVMQFTYRYGYLSA